MFVKLRNISFGYRRYLLGIALILSSVAISIRSNDGEIDFILGEYPLLIFFLVLSSSVLVGLYFHLSSREISHLSHQIKAFSSIENEDHFMEVLTDRQRQVYDLIIEGRSNKEIMSELFIEQSTLKSHINQIYRKLNIKSRRELKS